MGLDDFTKRIDRLWISALRGFNPNDIEFYRIGMIKRDCTIPLGYLFEKTDSREYVIISDNEQVDLDYQMLCGWARGGYMNTHDGYDTERYKAFNRGCMGEEPPKNPMELSFKEALEMYGGRSQEDRQGLDILMEYSDRKEAYDLGVKMAAEWPDFLKRKL